MNKYRLKIIDRYKHLLSARIVEVLPGFEIKARSHDKIIFLSTNERISEASVCRLKATAEQYLKPEFDKVVVLDGPIEIYMLEVIEEEEAPADPEGTEE